jgi:LPS sulfotransferase NodH
MKRHYPRWGARNPHCIAVTEHLGRISAGPADVPEHVTFLFLCFTNRCGSNYLADLLAATHRFWQAREFFNGDEVVEAARVRGHRTLQDYFTWLARHCATADGVVPCKLAVPHLEMLGEAGLLDQAIRHGRFVFMSRQDRLGQAISWEIARQTRRWTSEIAGELTDDAVVYSRANIDYRIHLIDRENRELETFFSANGIRPVRVQYEQLVEDPQEALDRIGDQLGFSQRLHVDPGLLTLSRQRGALNERMRRRYLAKPSFLEGLGRRILSRRMQRAVWRW